VVAAQADGLVLLRCSMAQEELAVAVMLEIPVLMDQ
jgi:hypothetical protein